MNQQTADLDLLMPNGPVITFTGRDKEKYSFPVFVSFSVGEYILAHLPKVAALLPKNEKVFNKSLLIALIKDQGLSTVIDIIMVMMQEEYPDKDIDQAWVKRNISIPQSIYILTQAAYPILEFIKKEDFSKWSRILADKESDTEKKTAGAQGKENGEAVE